jgi:uncharacterized phage-associated protein
MPPRFREEKATQAAARLLQQEDGRMNYMKLIKLLYLVDRRALLSTGRPVTFDSYFSLPHGPVLSFTLDKISTPARPDSDSYWNRFISEPEMYDVRLLADVPNDQLSPVEEELIDEVYKQFGPMNQWELRHYSHHLGEWQDPRGSSLRISIGDILLAGGLSEQEAAEQVAALEAEASAERILDSYADD